MVRVVLESAVEVLSLAMFILMIGLWSFGLSAFA